MLDEPGPAPSDAAAGPTAAQVRDELRQILSSQTFVNAKSLGKFLQYVTEAALNGEADHIKEYVLGTDVFGRGAAFDPRTDPIVRVQAVNLRSKLERYYETEGLRDGIRIALPKGSYVAVFEARWPAVDSAALELPAAAPEVRRRRPSALLVRSAAAIGAVLAATAYFYYMARGPAAPINSLAVLPFVNMTGAPENEYLGDGMTEELLDRLAQIEGLHVPARTSSFQFKNKAGDIGEIGRKLRVAAVLEGSVRLSGDRIRITAQLNRVSDGYHLWSHSFERERKDLFAAEDELANGIVQALEAGRHVGAASSAPARAVNAEAHDQYLHGRFFWNLRTAEGFRAAIRRFTEAVELDPDYSRAWAALAESYVLLAINGHAAPRDVVPKASAAAEKALALDDSLAEAHAAKGMILGTSIFPADLVGAERELRRAIALNPRHASVRQWYSRFLAENNRLEESLREIRTARDLDPVSPIIAHAHGLTLRQMGRIDEAIAEFRRALELQPSFPVSYEQLSGIYLERGACSEAISAQEKAVATGFGELRRRATLGETLAKCGHRSDALRIFDEVQLAARERYVSPVYVIGLALAVGRKDVALDCLERAFDERYPWVANLRTARQFAALGSEARFQKLAARVAAANAQSVSVAK